MHLPNGRRQGVKETDHHPHPLPSTRCHADATPPAKLGEAFCPRSADGRSVAPAALASRGKPADASPASPPNSGRGNAWGQPFALSRPATGSPSSPSPSPCSARLALDPLVGDRLPFLLFCLAVVAVAWHGGFGPSFLALLLGILAAAYFFLPPRYSLAAAWRPTGPGGRLPVPRRDHRPVQRGAAGRPAPGRGPRPRGRPPAATNSNRRSPGGSGWSRSCSGGPRSWPRPTAARTSSWRCWPTSCATRWPPSATPSQVMRLLGPADPQPATGPAT